jgi:hypothetical protein
MNSAGMHRWALAVVVLAGCGGDAEAVQIPEALRGAYGRSDQDAFFDTLGLEVDVDTLRFSELRLTVKTGKVVGADSLQITDAELSWAKDDKPPQNCKGTIAKQGNRLLLSLFRMENDSPCDSALAGEWSAWAPVTEIPAGLRGVYGRGDVYASAEGVRIDDKAITLAGAQSGLELVEGVAYEGRDDHLVVRRAKWYDAECRGSISVKEDALSGDLALIDGTQKPEPPAGDTDEEAFEGWLGAGDGCPAMFGARWTIDAKALPKAPVDNGKVKLEIRGETVMTSTLDEQGMRCEQAILRTAERKMSQSGRDGIPVMGGTVVVLTPATPKSGGDGCVARLKNLAANECESMFGMPCDPSLLGGLADEEPIVQCPTHLVIGEPDSSGRKIAVLPPSVMNAVCFEMTGHFKGG